MCFFLMDDDGGEFFHRGMVGSSSTPRRTVAISTPPSSAAVGVGVNGGANYITHTVSKFDTLAGVAIKYGVEVADIKRLNGLVTDLQMFALKTLQIPIPGRHPPSPRVSNGHNSAPRPRSSQQTPLIRRHSDLFDAFPSLRLKLFSEERTYSDLGSAERKSATEGFEMSVYRKGGANHVGNGTFSKSLPSSNPLLGQHRKSKSTANFLGSENGFPSDQLLSQEAESDNSDKWFEKLVRRCQKSEADFTPRTPEKLLKEDNTSSVPVSAITGKGLALRPKSVSRTSSGAVNGEAGELNPMPIGLGDSVLTDSRNGVRKSSSTSNLQDADCGALSSIWPTYKWSLKPDFQALSTAAALTRPIFDGLPKPSIRKNKTAVD